MPNPRKPTNLLLLNGGLKHNPKRYADRMNEPKPSGPIGDPPGSLTDEQKGAWREIVAECPPGVLTNADRGAVENMSVLRAYVREVRDIKAMALLLRHYSELGMTPASRSKVQAAKKEDAPQNAFAAV